MHKLERDLNNSVTEIQFWAVTNKRPINEDKTSVMIVTGKRLKSKLDFQPQGGLATAFDLAAFRLSMIAPVKKSVNHSRTVASMRETGWKQKQQEVCLRSDSTV